MNREAPAGIDQLDADALLRTLVEHEVDFVVIGGFAVAAHGFVRATKDLDIVPEGGLTNAARLLAAIRSIDAEPLETEEFRPEELPVLDLEGLAAGGNWALRTTHGRLDVMQWVIGIEGYDQLRTGALVLELPGVGAVRFAGYDELIAMKTAADRPEDRLDLERLRTNLLG